MTIKLRTQSVVADAPQGLCFEVVASAGRIVEEISATERLVEYKTDYRGREVVTIERLRLGPPSRIDYEWVKGPLPEVLESISFASENGDATSIVYEGTFDVTGGVLARLAARLWVKRSFERIVLEHLEVAKELAERRAQRSHIYRRERVADTDPSDREDKHERA